MSFKKTEKKDNNLYEIEFLLEKEQFDAAVERVYKKKAKSLNVPGFRKGKAPKSIIEKMYGSWIFYEDAINDLIPDAYTAAEKESGLVVVSRPEFDVVNIDDEGVLMKATVYTKPEVKIEGYLGMEATKATVAVTDDEVEHELTHVRERNSRTIDVEDREAQNGDVANIDFDGYVDGVAFDGGKAEGHDLTLGSGQFIPGFEEQIIGKKIGEEFDVNVTFPEDYHATELAGKASVFKCKLNALKVVELPALDDEFAKDVSEFDTLDEYKADIKAKITARKEKNADAALEETLLGMLVEKLEGDIPAPMIEMEAENLVRDYDNRLRSQGMDLNTYFKYTGQTLDQLRESMMPMAEKQVKSRLALETIVALENISATDEEIEAEYADIAKAYGLEVEKVKEFVDSEGVAKDVCVRKAMDLIKSKATVKSEKPAKKTTTKKSTAKKAEGETAEEKPAAAKKTTTTKKCATKKTTAAKAEGESAPAKKTTTKKTTAKKAEAKAEDKAE